MSQGSDEEVRSVPGLAQVLSACQLITKSKMTSVTVSIATSQHDTELIELSREAAEESGVFLDYERVRSMLVLRFTREQSGTQREGK